MSDKKTWEHYGSANPYYGVATVDKFRDKNLDEENRDEFFQSGEAHVNAVWDEIKTHFVSGFSPVNALDFGCGVGRLAIPMAAKCKKVTGVDISSTMLEEAGSNAAAMDIDNIEFRETVGDLSDIDETFDFVHSFIVLQHINPSDGFKAFERMVEMLEQHGVGALHVTFHNDATTANRLKASAVKYLPVLFSIRNRIRGIDPEPVIPIHEYNLNRVFEILYDHGCHRSFCRFTHHGLKGVMIFFQKTPGLLDKD